MKKKKPSIQGLRDRIQTIEERNKRVEQDKAWETSIARRSVITFLTYAIIVIVFYIIRLPKPFINALIPTIAFIISTLTLPVFKKIWIKNHKR